MDQPQAAQEGIMNDRNDNNNNNDEQLQQQQENDDGDDDYDSSSSEEDGEEEDDYDSDEMEIIENLMGQMKEQKEVSQKLRAEMVHYTDQLNNIITQQQPQAPPVRATNATRLGNGMNLPAAPAVQLAADRDTGDRDQSEHQLVASLLAQKQQQQKG